MFKLIMLVKKRDGLSDAEFRARWQAHSEKVLGFQAALRIRGYAKTLPLCHDTPATQRDTQPFPYDAMGELWYDSREIFETARRWWRYAPMRRHLSIWRSRYCGLARRSGYFEALRSGRVMLQRLVSATAKLTV